MCLFTDFLCKNLVNVHILYKTGGIVRHDISSKKFNKLKIKYQHMLVLSLNTQFVQLKYITIYIHTPQHPPLPFLHKPDEHPDKKGPSTT